MPPNASRRNEAACLIAVEKWQGLPFSNSNEAYILVRLQQPLKITGAML
jgi:hypothetical protein